MTPKRSNENASKAASGNNGSSPQANAIELLKAEHKKILKAAKELEGFAHSDDNI